MKDFSKWLMRHTFVGVLWVFLLSIRVGGETAFSYAHGFLVDNALVAAADNALGDLWGDVSTTAKLTFRQVTSETEAN